MNTRLTTKSTTTIIGIALSLAALLVLSSTVMLVPNAFAVKKFENCLIELANSHHKLTFGDVVHCFNTQFKSQRPLS